MKKNFFCLGVSILSILCLLPSLASAGPIPVGFIAGIHGVANAVDEAGASRLLSLKSEIYRSDTLTTGDDGWLQIIFDDRTTITLSRNSEMKVASYNWNNVENTGAIETTGLKGAFRVMGGKITKFSPKNFKMVTPIAVVGVRGSMFAGKSEQDLLVVVFEGGKGIDVSNPAGTVSITTVGLGTMVELNKAPLPPFQFSAVDLDKLNKELKKPVLKESDKGPDKGDKGAAPSSGAQGKEGGDDGSKAPAGGDGEGDRHQNTSGKGHTEHGEGLGLGHEGDGAAESASVSADSLPVADVVGVTVDAPDISELSSIVQSMVTETAADSVSDSTQKTLETTVVEQAAETSNVNVNITFPAH